MHVLLACTIYALLQGVNGAIDWAVAISTASAAAGAVTSGASMLQSLAGAPGYNVVCTVEIENWTKYPLVYPEASINKGIIKSPPVPVQPGKRESFIAHKTGHTATGTFGTASWLISSSNRRAVVMWSCPYNFDFHTNWLAVGLTSNGTTSHNKDWTNQMYYERNSPVLKYKLGQYYHHTKTISIKDEQFEITGIMGTSHKAKARIIVRPLQLNDLAESLKKNVIRKRRSADDQFENAQ